LCPQKSLCLLLSETHYTHFGVHYTLHYTLGV